MGFHYGNIGLTRYDLLARLVNEGFAAQQFCVLSIGLAIHDGMVLEQDSSGKFVIYSNQDGEQKTKHFSSTSEQEACEQYYQLICLEPTVLLLVGNTSAALNIQALLSMHDIQSKLQNVPANLFGSKKIQVVVSGKELGAARNALLFPKHEAPKKWWHIWN